MAAMDQTAVKINLEMRDNFTMREMIDAVESIAAVLNRIAGVALAQGTLTSANPVTQSLLTSATQAELCVHHGKQLLGVQSGLVVTGMQTAAGSVAQFPRRSN